MVAVKRLSSLTQDLFRLGVEWMGFPDRLDVGLKDTWKYLGSSCKGGCRPTSNSDQSLLEGFPALHNIETVRLVNSSTCEGF